MGASQLRKPRTPDQELPEWLDHVRLTVESEEPVMKALMMRAINAVLDFAALTENSVVNATAAPTDLAVLVRALSSGELLNDLKKADPLAPAFLRGIEEKRRLIDENGGTFTAEHVGRNLGITRQAVEKRRRAGRLVAVATGRHGYQYPVWQFTDSGTVSGLEDVLRVLAAHDEWMQTAFFVGDNPHLDGRRPVDALKAGEVDRVLSVADAYCEHGAA